LTQMHIPRLSVVFRRTTTEANENAGLRLVFEKPILKSFVNFCILTHMQRNMDDYDFTKNILQIPSSVPGQ
jgi:hypothetical protein